MLANERNDHFDGDEPQKVKQPTTGSDDSTDNPPSEIVMSAQQL